jgi:response regulator RpfG family c-di-GMP phosphodiesterase
MDTIATTSQVYNKSFAYYGYLRALPKKQHTLLICDDEPDLLELYAAMLSDDYKIIKTSSGEECIEKYNEMKDKLENITVILLDFRIGNVTGDKIARDIREINGAKIILISAYEINHDLIQRLKDEEVIVEFVSKPVSLDTLKRIIAKTIVKDDLFSKI